jgi:predicted nucleic acid-binding protein
LPTETRRTFSSRANESGRTRPTQTVVTDTDVLVALIHAGHLHFLGKLPGFAFVVTPDGLAAIAQPDQQRQANGAVSAGIVRVEQLSGADVLGVFAELRRIMGAGEAASLALAFKKGWAVASDKQGAFRREALARLGRGRILTTPGLRVLAIRAGLLSVAEADADDARLEVRKFKMGFSSFRDLISLRSQGNSTER